MNLVDTERMSFEELRPILEGRAAALGIDRTDPRNRFTLWSENGFADESAQHLLFEGAAAAEPEMRRLVIECAVKTGNSRTLVLDSLCEKWDGVDMREATHARTSARRPLMGTILATLAITFLSCSDFFRS